MQQFNLDLVGRQALHKGHKEDGKLVRCLSYTFTHDSLKREIPDQEGFRIKEWRQVLQKVLFNREPIEEKVRSTYTSHLIASPLPLSFSRGLTGYTRLRRDF